MAGVDQNQPAGRRPSHEDVVQLTAIGFTAGTFSALFGVGGGVVLVPLLVAWRGFDERKAAGTSLLAIVIISSYAVIAYGVFGHVDVTKGLLIGLPAVAGVLVGTWFQQRLSDRVLSGLFACMVLTIAVVYLVR
jgi:uncharacterized membrane protein YfcA